jgi:ABC-type bacteriocin/lantibiotic exporter with double-glycine peptidase domain
MLAGGILVMNGSMTPGMLVAYTSLLDSFVKPVNDLVGFVRKIQTLKADMSRVEDILKYRPDEKFDETSHVLLDEKLSGAVEGKNLTFGYSTLEPSLIGDFSFQLHCGSSIAIVGPSGCGKSTVSKMISGLYRPWEGEVLFDDVRIDQVPKAVIATSIATVSQDIHLFTGTIRDNLTMWNHGITDADLVKAAKDACIHDTITTKPGAYDYMLVENGSNLSGGQRQRLEIARALVTNPSILVLDEATSALDPIVEKEILDNIKRRGCTCVIVAHRLSAIRDCDEILVMERGKIVQRGTHEQLVQTDGHYKRLIQTI